MPGTLYVVATPIGNLEDITARALRILGQVDLIACEDTRRTKLLLNHYQLRTPVESYHQFSERRKLNQFLELLRSGKSIALVSDAGTPTVSDPGALLVACCRSEAIPVVAIPGPSALLAALASSSFAGEPFLFWGFLPSKSRLRRSTLQTLADQTVVLVFYESPTRLLGGLRDILEILGDRHAHMGRELTKVFEETLEGSVSQLIEKLQGRRILGEITLIVAGCPMLKETADLEKAAEQAAKLIQEEGLSKKEASHRIAARTGLSARALYQQLLQKSKEEKH